MVTLDLNGGYVWSTAGRTSGKIKIIVKAGQDFSAPVNSEMYFATNLKKNNFHWLDENGNIYRVGDPVPADVNTLTACWTFEEKFSFEAGSTYYFNLSETGIPGDANTDFTAAPLTVFPLPMRERSTPMLKRTARRQGSTAAEACLWQTTM